MFYFNILKYIIKHRKNLYYNSHNSCNYNESPMYQNYYDSIRTDSDDSLILKMFYDIPASQYGNQVHNKMYIIEVSSAILIPVVPRYNGSVLIVSTIKRTIPYHIR